MVSMAEAASVGAVAGEAGAGCRRRDPGRLGGAASSAAFPVAAPRPHRGGSPERSSCLTSTRRGPSERIVKTPAAEWNSPRRMPPAVRSSAKRPPPASAPDRNREPLPSVLALRARASSGSDRLCCLAAAPGAARTRFQFRVRKQSQRQRPVPRRGIEHLIDGQPRLPPPHDMRIPIQPRPLLRAERGRSRPKQRRGVGRLAEPRSRQQAGKSEPPAVATGRKWHSIKLLPFGASDHSRFGRGRPRLPSQPVDTLARLETRMETLFAELRAELRENRAEVSKTQGSAGERDRRARESVRPRSAGRLRPSSPSRQGSAS